jgi:hypothetical protein
MINNIDNCGETGHALVAGPHLSGLKKATKQIIELIESIT